MTAGSPSGASSHAPSQSVSGGGRSRSRQTIAYTGVTLIGGVSALVVLGFSVAQGDPTVVDVLLWGALAMLLLGSAVHQWWFAGRAADRSRHIHGEISADEVAATARESNGEVDTVRQLRVAHPGLSLRDAYELMQAHKQGSAGDSA